jgi:hypothetical protein
MPGSFGTNPGDNGLTKELAEKPLSLRIDSGSIAYYHVAHARRRSPARLDV